MSRFILSANGQELTRLNTMQQVETYLDRAVPDATEVSVYEKTRVAVRTGWTFKSPTATKPKSKSSRVGVPLRYWTPAETRNAIDYRKLGLTYPEIAKKLNRTVPAVTAQLRKNTIDNCKVKVNNR